MNLNLKPEQIKWDKTHYIYVEKTGPFMETAGKCWEELHKVLPEVFKTEKVLSVTAAYKMRPQMIYRAGAFLSEKPEKLPAGVKYEKLNAGNYLRFLLTGPYSHLPEACGKVFAEVEKNKTALRDGWFLENYANDPKTTPEEKLETEILLPV